MNCNTMTLKQKIGQLLVTGFPGEKMSDEFMQLVREYQIGNVILFRYNQKSREQLRRLCSDVDSYISNHTSVRPFITSDEEGGVVSRLPDTMARMPSAMAQASLQDRGRVSVAAELTAKELLDVGINFNLAPVLDINNNLDNPVIGVRSYGTNAQEVSRYAIAALEGYQREQILTSGKHFPGHGDTVVDSHLALPCINKPLPELETLELVPFRAAIKAGITAITVAHVLFPQLEPQNIPATMSYEIVTGLLRKKLGFNGLIISDCMEMNAIKEYYGTTEATLQAVKAGQDLVFISHTPELVQAAAEALERSVLSGSLPESRIDQAVNRILYYKNLLPKQPSELQPEQILFAQNFAKQFAAAAIDHSCKADFPIFELGSHPLFVSPARSHITRAANSSEAAYNFAESMKNSFGGTAVEISINPSAESIHSILQQASSEAVTSVVLGTVNGNTYPSQMELVNALTKGTRPFACVALRNPFELQSLPPEVFSLALYEYSPQTVELVKKHFVNQLPAGSSL